MDAEKRRALQAGGIDYDSGLERFMGNEALYEKFLLKFLSDASYQNFVDAMEAGDMPQAERAVHTMKGTAGNLSLDPLFYASDAMVKAIRTKQSQEKLQEIYKDVQETYQSICDVLKTLQPEEENI